LAHPEEAGAAVRRIAVAQRLPPCSGGSIFRYRVGQGIARFWFLNASALRQRRVIAPINPILIPQARAARIARYAWCLF